MCLPFLLVGATVLIVGDGAQDEADKLQGTWAVVSSDGIDAPEEALKQIRVIIRRETFHIMEPDREKEKGALREKEKSTFKLDPSQKPKAIDFTKDPNGSIRRGIYELDGDTLTLVLSQQGPRPTQILTKRPLRKFTGPRTEEDDFIIMVLKREKKQ